MHSISNFVFDCAACIFFCAMLRALLLETDSISAGDRLGEQAEIARAKSALSATLRRRLREVSKLQTDIGKIQKHQELVGMAWGQKASESIRRYRRYRAFSR